MEQKKSILQQVEAAFENHDHKIQVSSHIPGGDVLDNILNDAENGSLLAFTKLFRIVTYGVTTCNEDLENYLRAFGVFGSLELRYREDFRALDEVKLDEVRNKYFPNAFRK